MYRFPRPHRESTVSHPEGAGLADVRNGANVSSTAAVIGRDLEVEVPPCVTTGLRRIKTAKSSFLSASSAQCSRRSHFCCIWAPRRRSPVESDAVIRAFFLADGLYRQGYKLTLVDVG